MVEAMISALSLLLTPEVFVYLLIGVAAGLAVGIIPGLGGPSGVALLLPFTLFMDTVPALTMIIGLTAATSGIDSVPAILFAIPGTGASQATVLDGHPLARKGEAGRAFGAVYTSSLLGGLIGALVLTSIIPVARPVVLAFGPPELLMLGVLGIVMTATISGQAPSKGILAGSLGAMLAMIGVDHATATQRWTLGSLYLWDGIPLVIIGLGIFALPEIIDLLIRGTKISERVAVRGGVLRGVRDAFRHWFLVVRTSLLGTLIGMMPGLGGAVVDWFAYGHARSTEKGAHETFGTGDIRGVIGVDAATNAKTGGSLVPTLLFGVPGTVTMALLLIIFVVHGIQPGPAMVTTHLDLTLLLVWGLVLGNVVAAAACLALAGRIARVAMLPAHVIGPVVVVAITFAAVNARRSIWDFVTLLGLTALGWVMKRLRWPRPPLVIGFVLAPIIEQYLFISSMRYGIGWVTHPGVIVIALLCVLVVLYELRASRRRRREERQGATAGAPASRSAIAPGGPGAAPADRQEPADDGDLPLVAPRKPVHRDPEMWFTVGLGAVIVLALAQSFDWRFGARLMPQVIAATALVVIALRVGGRLLGLAGPEKHEAILDLPVTDDVPPKEFLRLTAEMFAWVAGFVVTSILVGMRIAIPVFLLSYLTVRARLAPWKVVLLTAAVTAVFAGVFHEVLGIRTPTGILLD